MIITAVLFDDKVIAGIDDALVYNIYITIVMIMME